MQMKKKWLKEALFAGMTANAFKLGTVLTLGWFWQRVNGCCILYRGESIEEINFDEILSVAELLANQISPPGYIEHQNNSTNYYLVRKANGCGQLEQTLYCAAKIEMDASGDLAKPKPNDIFKIKAEQRNSSTVKLTWFYNPIQQQSPPACFNIYCDNGCGQIDYENPIAVINYAGRKFYSYQTQSLLDGAYLFAIRTQNLDGVENQAFGKVKIQINSSEPDSIDILNAEAV